MKPTFIPWGSCNRRKRQLPCVAQRICVRVRIVNHTLQVTLGVGKQGVLLADLMTHAILQIRSLTYTHTHTHPHTHILHRCSRLNLVPNFLVSFFVCLNIMLTCLSPWVTLSVSVVQKSETHFLFVSGYNLQGAVSHSECGDLSSPWRLSEVSLFTLGLLGSRYWVIFGKPGLCPSSVWPPASLLRELSPDL